MASANGRRGQRDTGFPRGYSRAIGSLADLAAEAHARRRGLGETIGVLAESGRAMMIVDGDSGQIIYANRAADELFGGAVAGLALNRLIPERHRQAHDAHRTRFMERMVARPMSANVDVRASTKDRGEVLVRIALTPIPEERLVIVEMDLLEPDSD